MTSAQDIEMSLTTNGPPRDSFHLGDQIPLVYVTPGLSPFLIKVPVCPTVSKRGIFMVKLAGRCVDTL